MTVWLRRRLGSIIGLAFSIVAVVTAPAFAFAQPVANAPAQNTPTVQPAIDALMRAFERHPLVGIGSTHNVAQEQDLWIALVRDARFAKGVGNIVVEGGGAMHQAVMDRYVNGEDVPYSDLRKVWLDGLNNQIPRGISDTGNPYLYAAVREINSNLPPGQRIKVWLGEPPRDAALPRDSFAADLIVRNILDSSKKALVIFGRAHFFKEVAPVRGIRIQEGGTIRGIIERTRPDAFFVTATYTGLANVACSERFEEAHKAWAVPALVTSMVGTDLEAALTGPECRPPPGAVFSARNPTPEQSEIIREVQAALDKLDDEVTLGAMLYLGPSASLLRSASMPEAYVDPDYRRELALRGIALPKIPTDGVTARKFVTLPR